MQSYFLHICMSDVNKWNALGSAEQIVSILSQICFFFIVVLSPLEEESVILPVYIDWPKNDY